MPVRPGRGLNGLGGIGPHVGDRLRASRAAGAGTDVEPRRVLVEHQAHGGQHAYRNLRDLFGEVAEQDRTPRRDHQRGLDCGEKLGDPGLQYPQRQGGAEGDPVVGLRDPTDGRAYGRGPLRTRFGGDGQACQQFTRIVEFGHPPCLPADAGEALRDAGQRRDRVRGGQTHPGVGARQHQRGLAGFDQVDADVRGQPRDVAAPVVEAEPEPSRQFGQNWCGLDRGVQITHQTAHIGEAAGPARQRGGDDVADPLVRGRRQQARAGQRCRHGVGIGQRPQLDVAARREFHCVRTEVLGDPGKRRELRRGDHATGQPDPDQRAIGGPVHREGTRAGVVVSGSCHVRAPF